MRRQRSHRGDDRFEAPPFHDVLVNRRYVKIEVSPACRACGFHLPEGFSTVAGSTPRCSPTRASDQPAL